MNHTLPPTLRRLSALAVAVTLLGPALSGCTHTSPVEPPLVTTAAPPPTDLKPITPRRTPTPTAVASATPSSTTVASAVTPGTPGTSEDPLYQRAVGVYQTFIDEYTKALNAGGADKLPPNLNQVLDPALRPVFAASLARAKQRGYHYSDVLRISLQTVTPYPGDPPYNAVAAIQTCEHVTGTLVDADGQPVEEPSEYWQANNVLFGYTSSGTRLVMTSIWTAREVPCPAS